MSKNLRMLLIGFVALVVLVAALTKFGVLNPPVLGPLLNGEEEASIPDETSGAGGTGASTECPVGQIPDPAAAAATDSTVPDAGAAGTDATTDPTITGSAGVGSGAGPDGRIVAAGGGAYADGAVSDTPIYAADATTDPGTGLPDADPDTGTDPAAGTGTDPSTGLPGTSTDPAATDPAATADPSAVPSAGCVPDPALDAGAGADPGAASPGTDGAAPGTGTGGTGAGGAAAGGAPAGAGASTSDGSNDGNSPEALRIAADAAGVMQQAKISVAVQATLLPAAGGAVGAPAVRAYRRTVTAAVLVIKLNDANAQNQWTTAGKRVQVQLVRSFLQRLRKNYPRSSRSVSVVDSTGRLLAVGDATAGRASGAVKLL